jgi:hypothetical protein
VPDELVGEAEAIASDTEKKNGDDDDKQQYHEKIGRMHLTAQGFVGAPGGSVSARWTLALHTPGTV